MTGQDIAARRLRARRNALIHSRRIAVAAPAHASPDPAGAWRCARAGYFFLKPRVTVKVFVPASFVPAVGLNFVTTSFLPLGVLVLGFVNVTRGHPAFLIRAFAVTKDRANSFGTVQPLTAPGTVIVAGGGGGGGGGAAAGGGVTAGGGGGGE